MRKMTLRANWHRSGEPYVGVWQPIVLVLTVIVFSSTSRAADSWPEFRGPTGQGHSTARNVPIRWSETENIIWKVAIPGKGWSSPVIHAGHIYLTTAVPRPNTASPDSKPDQSLRSLCLDEATGSVVWDEEVFLQDGTTAPNIHSKNSHASPTPIVDNGQLFVHFGHEGIACLDTAGKTIWKTRELRYKPQHGNGGSPALIGDNLIVICDGIEKQFTVNLNRNTGRIRWRTNRETEADLQMSFCTPLVIEAGGRTQVVSPGAHHIGGYDLKTGEELWYVTYNGWSLVPRPVYSHGLVFFSTGYMEPQLFAVRPDGEGDVTDTHVLWSTAKSVPNNPSMLVIEDELYTISDDGVLTCFDAASGKVHYRERIGGNHSASPIYVEGRIYLLSEQGQGTVVKAGRRFEKIATNELGQRTFASYVPVDGALLVRSERHLYRIEEKDN